MCVDVEDDEVFEEGLVDDLVILLVAFLTFDVEDDKRDQMNGDEYKTRQVAATVMPAFAAVVTE